MKLNGILLAGAMALAAPTHALTPAPTGAPVPAINLEEAARVVSDVDMERLFRDRAYAEQVLRYIDAIKAARADDTSLAVHFDSLRLFPLAALERPDEIRSTLDRVLEQRPREAQLYGGPLIGALAIVDKARVVAVIETSSQNVPASGWAVLRDLYTRDIVSPLLSELHQSHDEAVRVRAAAALFRIGWPGGGDTEAGDFIRTILIDDRIAHDDSPAAADFAAGITTPSTLLPLILRKRYDPVFGAAVDRHALLRRVLEEHDRATTDALAAGPRDLRSVLNRAQFLRGMGREADAYALLAPFTRDVRATVAAGETGMWVINEAAYALGSLDRHPEAMRLMERLTALPVEDNIGLIGPFINRTDVLRSAGRYAEALAWAQRLDRDYARFANDYGKMWIASASVCALARLNRNGEAGPVLERLRGGAETNPAALSQAYLCLGDSDAAAALMVHRLESDDPESAILALQDYGISSNSGTEDPEIERLKALRERPEVRAALERVGRSLTLPLARTYWGTF